MSDGKSDWTIDGVDEELQRYAEEQAAKLDMSVGEWLSKAIQRRIAMDEAKEATKQ